VKVPSLLVTESHSQDEICSDKDRKLSFKISMWQRRTVEIISPGFVKWDETLYRVKILE
jgi:hypothetical protein